MNETNTCGAGTPAYAKLLERIRKLLSLGNADRNNSVHEAEAALAKAHELMRQHNIAMSDVEVQAEAARPATEAEVKLKGNVLRWKMILAKACARLFDCDTYIARTLGGSKIRIYGQEVDRAVAVAAFEALYATVYRVSEPLPHHDATSYRMGFAVAVRQRVDKLKAEQAARPDDPNGRALVVTSHKLASLRTFSERKGLQPIRTRHSSVNPDAYSRGYAHGQATDLNLRPSLKSR